MILRNLYEDVKQLFSVDAYLAVAAGLSLAWQGICAFFSVKPRAIVLAFWSLDMLIGTLGAIWKREWRRDKATRGVARFAAWFVVLAFCGLLHESGPIEGGVASLVEAKIVIIEFASVIIKIGQLFGIEAISGIGNGVKGRSDQILPTQTSKPP